MAEVMALRKGINFASSYMYGLILMELDNLEVVEACHSKLECGELSTALEGANAHFTP